MSDQDLVIVLAHIEDDPQFARRVADDARADGRHWTSRTLLLHMTMRNPHLQLTPDEKDSAIAQAKTRRDHPLTPEQLRQRRTPPRPEAPCAEKRRAVDAARQQLLVADIGTAAFAAAATATGVTAAAVQRPGEAQNVAIVSAVVSGLAGGYASAMLFLEHSRTYRRTLDELKNCLARNNLRAEAERLGSAIAAIDTEIVQLHNRIGMA